jgi:hypothetical protein
MSKIICADNGEPYSTEGRCNVEILFLISERALTLEELHWYADVQRRINAAAERVAQMSDEEILRK